MKRFEGKVALVTGSTSGIGRATALHLAREGARVIVSGRREREGRAVVAEIERAGGQARFVRADVSVEREVAALVESTLREFGRLDIAVNNAGTEGRPAPLVEQDEDAFHALMEINVKGVWLSMKHELPAIERSGGGAVINVSSVAGQIGFPTMSLYSASKAAVDALSRTAALEYAQRGIRINVVAPGAVETDMLARVTGGSETALAEQITSLHPIGRFGTSDEIAGAIAWLASDEASFVLGQVIAVDGGVTAH